jgi:hypothetical protein
LFAVLVNVVYCASHERLNFFRCPSGRWLCRHDDECNGEKTADHGESPLY